MGWIGLGLEEGQVASPFEYDNNGLVSTKCGEFLDYMRNSQLLRKNSVPGSE